MLCIKGIKVASLSMMSVSVILLNRGSTNKDDKELEDEEQLKWLEEWRKRKGK